MANDRITNNRVLRLQIALPHGGFDRAAVTFMNVKTTRGIPHAHTMLHAALTNCSADPSDPESLEYVLRAHARLIEQIQR